MSSTRLWLVTVVACGLAACGGGGGSGDQAPAVVNTAPIASFTATPASGTPPLTVTVDASASFDRDGFINSYQWDFGSNATGSGVTANHVYDSEGAYTVRLTVTDNGGSSASATRQVVVSPAPVSIQLSAQPEMVYPGRSTTLAWSTVGATDCTASGEWSGSKATAGSSLTGPLAKKAIYTLACNGATGQQSASVSVEVWEPRYRVFEVPTPVVRGVRVAAMNGKGQIAATLATQTGDRAFVWNGSKSEEVLISDVNDSFATDINDAGTVVGSFRLTSDPQGTRGFTWDASGFVQIPSLGDRYATTSAINSRGQVVGQAYTLSGEYRVFVWDGDDVTELESTFPGERPRAFDINDAGDVVGTSGDRWPIIWMGGQVISPFADLAQSPGGAAKFVDPTGNVVGEIGGRAFLWRAGEVRIMPRYEGPLFLMYRAKVNAINATGMVVGSLVDEHRCGSILGICAFIWDGSESEPFVTPIIGQEMHVTSALSVNNEGHVVGFRGGDFFDDVGAADYHSAVIRYGHWFVDLQTLIDDDDPLKAHVSLLIARVINDLGQVAVEGIDRRTGRIGLYVVSPAMLQSRPK